MKFITTKYKISVGLLCLYIRRWHNNRNPNNKKIGGAFSWEPDINSGIFVKRPKTKTWLFAETTNQHNPSYLPQHPTLCRNINSIFLDYSHKTCTEVDMIETVFSPSMGNWAIQSQIICQYGVPKLEYFVSYIKRL